MVAWSWWSCPVTRTVVVYHRRGGTGCVMVAWFLRGKLQEYVIFADVNI